MYPHFIGNYGFENGNINACSIIEELKPWVAECELPRIKIEKNNKVNLYFLDIEEHTSTPEEGEPIVTYTKDNYVDVLDGDGEVIGLKNEPIDFTTEMLGIIAEIEQKVVEHDPTPILQPKTETEILKETVNALMYEITMIKLDRGEL